jgi:uncharacterized protein YndB with AHSA1/START domain
MPTFDDATITTAPVEEVWKLLYDPERFPEWWAGIASVTPGDDEFTLYAEGHPDFPMPHTLTAAGRGVTISCLTSDLLFEWRLEEHPAGTRIGVHVEIPEPEAHRLEAQRGVVSASLRSLAALAENP